MDIDQIQIVVSPETLLLGMIHFSSHEVSGLVHIDDLIDDIEVLLQATGDIGIIASEELRKCTTLDDLITTVDKRDKKGRDNAISILNELLRLSMKHNMHKVFNEDEHQGNVFGDPTWN